MNSAILLAAGEGSRFHESRYKQFISIRGKPVMQYSVDLFSKMDRIDCFGILIPRKLSRTEFDGLNLDIGDKCAFVDHGGASRRESVLKGLRGLSGLNPDRVFIHDVARPAVSAELVIGLSDFLNQFSSRVSGVIPVIEVNDTIKQINPGKETQTVRETLDRETLRRVQTPQLFKYDQLFDIHESWNETISVTDDSMMLEHEGYDVGTISGDTRNLKLTHSEDRQSIQRILSGMDAN